MSLRIDIDKVAAVMIGDEWWEVDDQKGCVSSFALDAYEYVYEGDVVLGGGREQLVPATGFTFVRGGRIFAGPITSIQAVRLR